MFISRVNRDGKSPAALLTGLLITGLMAGYLFLLTGRTSRVEKLVTERNSELQSSEQRFRLLVENAADGFFLHDDNGRILNVNQRASELLGYSREELLQMNVMDFEVGFKPEEHHELTWKRPASDFPINVDGMHRRKDGSTYPVEVPHKLPGNRRKTLDHGRRPRRYRTQSGRSDDSQGTTIFAASYRPPGTRSQAHGIRNSRRPGAAIDRSILKLQSLETIQEKQEFPAARKILDDVLHLIRESVAEARRLIGGLRPPILDESGIVAAIKYLCAERGQSGQSQIEFVPRVQFSRLAAPMEVALFRIVQECLNNACRHSQSPKIRVELSQLENRVRLTVQDWGLGFDPQEVKGEHFGLRGIRERSPVA